MLKRVRPQAGGGDPATRRPLSVSQLNQAARAALEQELGDVWLEAEVSGFKSWQSGHWYFTLKDDQASISAVMFRGANRVCRVRPSDGLLVQARGKVTLYPQRGTYQIVVESLEPAGAGALMLALEKLKRELAAEGLFDTDRKRELPLAPRRIGIATSQNGAALQDMFKVLRSRNARLQLVVAHCTVQGEGAAPEIAAALSRLDRLGDLDAIIVGRGGGSLEDLWAFNTEEVVRAIAACSTPVISAVGHEVDTTLADLVADVRAATPSQAAELVSASGVELSEALHAALERLRRALASVLSESRHRLDAVSASRVGASLSRALESRTQQLDHLQERLTRSMAYRLQEDRGRLVGLRDRLSPSRQAEGLSRRRERLAGRLDKLDAAMRARLTARREALLGASRALTALSPLAVLERGYSVIEKEDGRIVRSEGDVGQGELLSARLRRGTLSLEVVAKRPDSDQDGQDEDGAAQQGAT